MAVVEVAIGIVVEGGKVLIGRRAEDAHLGGFWEFPGGKCRAGESPGECVVREVREEVGLSVVAEEAWAPIAFAYPDVEVRLHPFRCRIVAGRARALGTLEVRWVDAEALGGYAFPPANASLIARIVGLAVAGVGGAG